LSLPGGDKINDSLRQDSVVAPTIDSSKDYTTKCDWPEIKLKGRVKSVSEIMYRAIDDGGIVKEGEILDIHRFKIMFDDKGNEITEIDFDQNGEVRNLEEIKSKFDFAGNKVQEVSRSKNLEIDRKSTYGYDKNGNKRKEEIDILSDAQILNFYDSLGNKVESKIGSAKDALLRITTKFSFDKNGNEISDIRYDSYGELMDATTRKYDLNNNVIEEETHARKNSLLAVATGKTSYVNSYKYTYDERGNWVKVVSYEDGKPEDITERTIEYFTTITNDSTLVQKHLPPFSLDEVFQIKNQKQLYNFFGKENIKKEVRPRELAEGEFSEDEIDLSYTIFPNTENELSVVIDTGNTKIYSLFLSIFGSNWANPYNIKPGMPLSELTALNKEKVKINYFCDEAQESYSIDNWNNGILKNSKYKVIFKSNFKGRGEDCPGAEIIGSGTIYSDDPKTKELDLQIKYVIFFPKESSESGKLRR
jgi:uncharacterized protein YkuJ